MIWVTFVYDEDAEMLEMMTSRLRELDKDAKIYAVEDAAHPLPAEVPGVVVLSTTHERGGNLNGLANLGGMLAIFERILRHEKADYLVKIDADSWVNDVSPFLQVEPMDGRAVPDYLAAENWEAFRPSGNIYRLSRWMLMRLIQMYNERSRRNEWPPVYNYPEDQTIFRMACMTRLPMELLPQVSGYSVGQFDEGPDACEGYMRAGIIHCGEPDKKGRRVGRGHATLRMRVLQHAVARRRKM